MCNLCEYGEQFRVHHHLEAIKVRGQETRKKRVCHDFIPHTASVGGVVVAVVMFLSDIAIASDRYPSIITRVVVVTERQRKKLPISFHVRHVHLRKLTATVPSKPYHSFKSNKKFVLNP